MPVTVDQAWFTIMGGFTPKEPPPGDDLASMLVQKFAPWLTGDLETYLRAVASMWEQVELYAFDRLEDDDGYTVMVDPDLAPVGALPWLAQFVGERLPPGIDEAGAREWIKDNPNARRGTNRAIFQAVQRRLIGSRLVTMTERADGVVDKLRIVTYTSETPDPGGTLIDLKEVVPADVLLDYVVTPGQIWNSVKTSKASWTAVKSSWADWGLVRGVMVGDTYYRPLVLTVA